MSYRANPEFLRKVEKAARSATAVGLLTTQNKILDKLDEGSPGQGRIYKRGRRQHRASKPGDPPATDTGRLKTSINIQQLGPYKGRVGTNVRYALLLEFGTPRVKARPFVRPVMAQDWPEIQRAILAEFRRKMA